MSAAKELVAGSQTWSVETEERAPVLPAVNIDVWSKEKANEIFTGNCGLGLDRGSKKRPKNPMLYISFPHLPMPSVDLEFTFTVYTYHTRLCIDVVLEFSCYICVCANDFYIYINKISSYNTCTINDWYIYSTELELQGPMF